MDLSTSRPAGHQGIVYFHLLTGDTLGHLVPGEHDPLAVIGHHQLRADMAQPLRPGVAPRHGRGASDARGLQRQARYRIRSRFPPCGPDHELVISAGMFTKA